MISAHAKRKALGDAFCMCPGEDSSISSAFQLLFMWRLGMPDVQTGVFMRLEGHNPSRWV